MMKSLLYYSLLNIPITLNFYILMIMLTPMKSMKLHPLMMIIILIILTLMISLKMMLMFKSWMNFILVLIMIGGLLIIFMYIASLANNELFTYNLKNILSNLIKFSLIIILTSMFMNLMFNEMTYFNTNDIWSLISNTKEELNEMILSEMYNSIKYTMLFIMLYLYYSMICIMNICYKLKSPLRQMYSYYE